MAQSLVLGVVGWSGSGKTSLLEYLIKGLTSSGYVINLVKHSHHDVQTEPAHKDSARLRLAGAQQTVLVSPYRVVTTHELRQQLEPDLAELLAGLKEADLTLVEGYKWLDLPKLEVHRPVLGKTPLFCEDTGIIALACDQLPQQVLPSHLLRFDLNQPESILAWLIAAVQNRKF